MRIAIYSRGLKVHDAAFIQKLMHLLRDRAIDVLVHRPYLNELLEYLDVPRSFNAFGSHKDVKDGIDFMFSLGGDGTLLDTVSFVRNYNVPVLGINIGRLGFLANIGKDEVSAALDALANGSYVTEKRTMLALESNPPLFGDVNYALNEFTVAKKDTATMLTVNTYLNGEFLNTYWADGLIVATATGSTAYSLSCGGPIMAPSSSDFIITPIAPHNLNVRPIVVPDSSVITFEITGRTTNFLCTLDSRHESIDTSHQLAVKKCEHQFNIVRLPDHNFLRTLSSKLHWGTDARK